jgi:hypothetical protein
MELGSYFWFLQEQIKDIIIIISLPFNSISVPGFKNLTTDITLLPNYNKLDLARSHASILPSLPPLFSPLTLDKVGLRVS